jgi:two-component system, chemotaxis family, response regulator Rcp1
VSDSVPKPIELLLVEDNPGDVRLVQEALKDGKIANGLSVASDGIEAMAMLRREGGPRGQGPADLVLLDLNLPGMDGREVLAEIKANPDLARIPVVVMTSSKAEEDVVRSYHLHANAYVTKPLDLEQFIGVVQSIGEFWLRVVKLPARDGSD